VRVFPFEGVGAFRGSCMHYMIKFFELIFLSHSCSWKVSSLLIVCRLEFSTSFGMS
jgi:hypothetical protein